MKSENIKEAINTIKIYKGIYFGNLIFAATHPEEVKILSQFSEKDKEIAWNSLSLLPRQATKSMIDFAIENEILDIFSTDSYITINEIKTELEKKGFIFDTWNRTNMLTSLLDILSESGMLIKKHERNNLFKLNNKPVDYSITAEEQKFIEKNYSGSINFFDKCTSHAKKFMKGNEHYVDFGSKSTEIWNNFLTSSEFRIGREFSIKSMRIKNHEKFNVLNLCYGSGEELKILRKLYPKIDLVAIDFTDAFQKKVKLDLEKIENQDNLSIGSTKILNSSLWSDGEKKGFGVNLPFEDNSFDRVLITATDPFIPLEERYFVYEDIYRILKPGGILGMMSWQYPDENKIYYKDNWVRRAIFRHNFAESVVEGFYGFHDVYETINMFKNIGYHINDFETDKYYLFDGIFWRLSK